jgi:hypothetical protein
MNCKPEKARIDKFLALSAVSQQLGKGPMLTQHQHPARVGQKWFLHAIAGMGLPMPCGWSPPHRITDDVCGSPSALFKAVTHARVFGFAAAGGRIENASSRIG